MKKKSQQLLQAKEFAKNNPEISITSIAKKFDVDRGALTRTIADDTDYSIDGHDGFWYYFSDVELQMIEYYQNHPHVKFLELQRIFNVSTTERTFKRWLEVLNIDYQPHFKYSNNRNAFSQIVTEEDAYWLGFITADGYISEDNNWLDIHIGEIDLEHLKKFLRYMNFTEEEIPKVIHQGIGGAKTKDNIVYNAVICGKQLIQNLKQYGLTQGKSGKEIPYQCATIDLEKAYIRGLWDGDGCIRSTQYGVSLVGSQQILEYVRNFLANQLGWVDYKEKYIHPHGVIYKLEFGGKNISQMIVKLLYEGSSIYLNRKFDLYKQYCRV